MDIETGDFYEKARDLGLTSRQIKRLRDNRLFPPTTRKGMGRGRGQKFFYTEQSLKQLETLVEYVTEFPRLPPAKDLRWNLWLREGWDWLWDGLKGDLVDMLPGVLTEGKEDIQEATSWLERLLSKGRHKLFKEKENVELFRWTFPWVIGVFVEREISRKGTKVYGRSSRIKTVEKPNEKDLDVLFGEGSFYALDFAIRANLFSLYLCRKALQDARAADAARIRDEVAALDKAWNEDEEFSTLRKILGIRPLRNRDLHRLPRAVFVCTCLLLPEGVETKEEC